MGTLTGAQMETEVKNNLGGRSDLDSRLYIFLNWAQEEIARQVRLRELQQIDTGQDCVASQAYISHPTNMRDLISIRVLDGTNSRKLIWIPRRKFDKKISKPDEYTEGTPTHYTSWGTNFYLWRIPDEAFATEIQYIQWPTAFTAASGSASDIERMDEAICALATAAAMASLKDFGETFGYWNQRASLLINIAMRNDKGLFIDEAVVGDYDYQLSESAPNYWQDPFVRGNP